MSLDYPANDKANILDYPLIISADSIGQNEA